MKKQASKNQRATKHDTKNVDLNILMIQLSCDDDERKLNATRCIRKLLSIEKTPAIDRVLAFPGLLPRLFQFLNSRYTSNVDLQFEVLWLITNIGMCYQVILEKLSVLSMHNML